MRFNISVGMDFDDFENEVYAAACVMFAKLQRDRSDETFYTFNFCTGDVMQNVYLTVNTEEELERFAHKELAYDDRYLDVPFEDLKTHWRFHAAASHIMVYTATDDEFGKRFARANGMLEALEREIDQIHDRTLEERNLSFFEVAGAELSNSFIHYVVDNIYPLIQNRLKNVLRRLDREAAFELTNRRENIHLGVLESTWTYDELPGPFYDINPAESCRRYERDKEVFHRVLEAI